MSGFAQKVQTGPLVNDIKLKIGHSMSTMKLALPRDMGSFHHERQGTLKPSLMLYQQFQSWLVVTHRGMCYITSLSTNS